LQNLAYGYDAVGNLTSINDPLWSGARSFQYDDLNRLIEASGTFGTNEAPVTQDYAYDPIGNILYKAGVYYCYGYMSGCTDNNHRSAVKSTTDGNMYSYDNNGNVLTGAGRTYTWNGDNRLDTVSGPGGSAVMTYDYTGIRIKKSGSSGTTIFPFTGYEDQGGTITKYIRLGNDIIASKQGTNTRFYHNDHLGGINVLSDFNGARLQLNEYDPWGKVSRAEGNTEPTHRFTGQELDPESGIHYYGGRYYDQGLGRFISPDPFVQDPDDPQNLNRYAYVLNSPQNYIDPNGYTYTYYFGDESWEETPGDIHLNNLMAAASDARGGGITLPSVSASQAGTVFSTTGWSNGSTNWSELGSSAWLGIQGITSAATAYGGATTLAAYAGTAGGCAAAIPACVLAGLAFVGGVFGAADSVTTLFTGQQSSILDSSFQTLLGKPGPVVGAMIGTVGPPGSGASKLIPNLGRKLDYFLGRATGSLNNINRSKDMLRQLERIGLPDTPTTRQYLKEHLSIVVNDPTNILRIQNNGRVVRESLLMGPRGGVKLETIWEGESLITGRIFGGP
jgi:RHS repeat-associated protein